MRKLLVVLVAAAMLATMSLPANAATYQEMYVTQINGLYFGSSLNSGSTTETLRIYGGKLRVDSRTTRWGASGQYLSLSGTLQSTTTQPWASFSAYNVFAHYRFGPDVNTYAGVFGGWAGLSLGASGANLGADITTSGFALGVEGRYGKEHGFYLYGSLAYGPGWTNNWSAGTASAGTGGSRGGASLWWFVATAGYSVPIGTVDFGLEASWDSYSYNIPSGAPVCATLSICTLQFSGPVASLFIKF